MMRQRHYTGIFQGLGLVFLLLLALAALTMQTPPHVAAQAGIPTLTPVPSATPVVTAGPSPTPTATTVVCRAALSLTTGSYVYVKAGVNIRNLPTVSGGLVNYYEKITRVVVTGGPVCADGFIWWQVNGPGNPGWVAEGKDGTYWIIPPDPAELTPVSCPAPLNLVIGSRVELYNGLRVRENPGLSGLVLTVAPAEALVEILAGPVCADRYNWWQVRTTVAGVTYTGWMVEGDRAGDDYVVPEGYTTPIPCDFPLRLEIGQRAYVRVRDSIPKSLRTEPDLDGQLLYTLVDGVPFIVLGGPVCSDGYNWWQVRILASSEVVGWLAEGGPANYWIGTLGSYLR